MMKGYTKIELTDVNTGKKKVVEHKNMITNAMSALARSFQFLSPPLRSSFFGVTEPFVKTAFGGIFLFESPLSDDPDDFMMPDDNKVVGYGCGLANNSINTMMGSYNTSESGKQEDGSYKHVWDYSTDQGNGEISAVGLAPKVTGQMGWGMPLDLYVSSLNVDSNSKNVCCGTVGMEYQAFNLFIKNGFLYRISYYSLVYNSSYSDKHISRGRKLVIQRLKVIDETFGMYSVSNTISEVYDTIEIEVSSTFLASLSTTATEYYAWAQYDSGYIYVLCSTSKYVSAGASFKMLKISIDDYSVETITVTNNTGSAMYYSGDSTNAGINYRYSVINNGKMLVNLYGKSSKKYIIDLADNSNVRVLKDYGTDTESTSNLFLQSWFGSYVLCKGLLCVNMNDGTLRKLNASEGVLKGMSGGGWGPGFFVPIIGDKVCYCSSDGSTGGAFGFNPFLLTTKNNLETPVTKTAAQTMKITYILTEEA